jgi:hypothetical protein
MVPTAPAPASVISTNSAKRSRKTDIILGSDENDEDNKEEERIEEGSMSHKGGCPAQQSRNGSRGENPICHYHHPLTL